VIELAKANGMTVISAPFVYGANDFRKTSLKEVKEFAEQAGFFDAIRDNISWDDAWRMNDDPDYGNQLLENLIDTLPDPQKREELRQARTKVREYYRYYVRTVISEFQGQVDIWVLANEYDINPDFQWDTLFWLAGPDYPDLIFQAAREADPSAKLIINPAPGKEPRDPYFFDMTTPVIQRLKARGVIDGVGDQGHEDASRPFDWEWRFNRDWGVEVLITERDVDLRNIAGSNEERYALQADIYAYFFREALDHGVKFFGLWECYGDKNSCLDERCPDGDPNADPTLFYDDYSPKPACFALKDELQERIDQL